MRSIARLTSVGLLTALVVATFVACKKEKEQNGPSIIIPNEPGIVTADLTLPPQTDTVIRFKVIFQKGSGKDDADLKDFSFSFNAGAGNNPVITNRPAPNGTSFTFDTSFSIRGTTGQTYTYTFTVRDKNDKTASRSFRITFGQGSPREPSGLIDTLITQNVMNQSDNAGTHIRYVNGTLSAQTRSEANNNPQQILFVYFYSSAFDKHSLISPAILRDPLYNGTSVEWDNTATLRTDFRNPPSGTNFASATYQDIRNAYDNGQDISQEFSGNGTQRVECITGRTIAFKQGNIYGLVYVDNATTNPVAATISIKVARP